MPSRLWTRIVADSKEPENDQACWLFTGKLKCRFQYGRVNVWVPGLRRTVKLSVHIVSWLLHQPEVDKTLDGLYLAYLELRHSGLQLDHECVQSSCFRPDHLQPLTHIENTRLRDHRRRCETATFTSQIPLLPRKDAVFV